MAKTKQEINAKSENAQKSAERSIVGTSKIPIATRGRIFEGFVTKKFTKRVVVEFERNVYVQKYERFYKKKTRLHARLPDSMANEINVGDYIKIKETRPLSKIIHFIVIEKIIKETKK
jgi:ribosomal protein S17